ncbi:hypothetical protein JHD50_09655 [Sulfurimonas sp. MAG313]|nr:hypothetical protein [Sulfurimonas sp. MAG313]MDF1881563.1 hypothetical protein [Sulfurimonas sp. MAG313]
MNVNTALSAYSQQSLSIDIRTSSGDLIELDFNNEKSLNYSSNQNETSFSFSSLESFSFSYEGNGIDAQDRKEIEAFLKIAQPNIDNFVAGLKEGSSLTEPISKIAGDITSIFNPIKEKGDDHLLNFAKEGLSSGLDKALEQNFEPKAQTQDILANAQRFLEQMIKLLDQGQDLVYG